MRRRRALGTALTLLAVTGCARGTVGSASAPPAHDPCTIAPLGSAGPDTVHIALPSPFDPARLGRPQNAAEATLVAALYETLVETDCRNAPMPALAIRWSSDTTRTRWSFELRPDARFRDGPLLTAQAVAAAWSDRSIPRPVTRTDARARIQSVQVTGTTGLTVQLDRPADATLFADPALGVHRPNPESQWPDGSGPYEVVSGPPPGRAGYTSVRLRRVRDGPSPTSAEPLELRFEVPPSSDLRNALDFGADLVVTRDFAVREYARALADYAITPLPWDRTYLLLTPGGVVALPMPEGTLEGLARDAVRGDARAAAPRTVHGTEASAETSATRDSRNAGNLRPGRGAARIVYQRDDDAARGLAERLVALLAEPDRHPWLASRLPDAGHGFTADGLAPAAFTAALRRGDAAGYVLGLSTADLAGGGGSMPALPWLPASAVARGATITPLVETRPSAIHRTSMPAARFDATGTLRFISPSKRTRQ